MSDTAIGSRPPGTPRTEDLLGEDWPTQTADTIERVVGSIRSKTTEPVERIVRVVVYGLVAAVLGIAALVLVAAALVRAIDIAVPGEVWSAHLILGALFTLLGLFMWSKRAPKDDRHR